jgi:hypothetical protein
MNPRSSIDFLLESQGSTANQRSIETPRVAAEDLLDKATSLFGGQILNVLRQAPGQTLDAFDLVDRTQINIQTLHQVLDAFASARYGWVELDKQDPKGNYRVRLSEYGKKYLDSLLTPA